MAQRNQPRRAKRSQRLGAIGPVSARPVAEPRLESGLGSEDTILVSVDNEGTFLAFGGLPGQELTPFTVLSDGQRRRLDEQVALSIGGLNVGAQALKGLNEARGLVRLAPETWQAMKAGSRPVVRGGWNLGTLGKNGTFTNQVRWLPAGSAGAVSVLAAIGPAAALVAIQFQLAKISRLVEKNIAVTNTVLELVRVSQWSEVHGHHDFIANAVREAEAAGAVTPSIWGHVQAQSSDTTLRTAQHLFLTNVRRHAAALASLRGAPARREWLASNGNAVLGDVDALVMAHRSWLAYQALRVGSLAEAAESSEQETLGRDWILISTREQTVQVLEQVQPLLDGLYRHFRLMQVCPGGMGLKLKDRVQTPAQVAEAARILADQLGGLAGQDVVERESAAPTDGWLGVGRVENIESVAIRLHWILDRDEELVVVARAKMRGWFSPDVHLAITDRRILILKDAGFTNEGLVDTEIRWDDSVRAKALPEGHGITLTTSKSKHEIVLPSHLSQDEVTYFLNTVQNAAASKADVAKTSARKESGVLAR